MLTPSEKRVTIAALHQWINKQRRSRESLRRKFGRQSYTGLQDYRIATAEKAAEKIREMEEADEDSHHGHEGQEEHEE